MSDIRKQMPALDASLLRQEWLDDPNLDDEMLADLTALDDAQIESALDDAFDWEIFNNLLEQTKTWVTLRLLEELGA